MKLRRPGLFVSSLVVVGSLAIVYGAYQFFWRSPDRLNTQHAQDMTRQWVQRPSPVPSPSISASHPPTSAFEPTYTLVKGQSFAVIRIPKINVIYPVMEGTDDAVLAKGVGHYAGTAGPGQVGNFATAGHVCCRDHGSPYKQLHSLHSNDLVIVETSQAIFTYSVVALPQCSSNVPYQVTPDRVDVIQPSPCSQQSPTQRMLTMTTCYPDRSIVNLAGRPAPYRLVVFAELINTSVR